MGNGGKALFILNLGAIWRCVVSLTPRLVFSQWKSPHYPLNWRLGRPQGRSGHFGEGRNLLPLQESNHDFSFFNPITTVPVELSSLLGTWRHTVTCSWVCCAEGAGPQTTHQTQDKLSITRHWDKICLVQQVLLFMCCCQFHEKVAPAVKVKTVTNCAYSRP